MPIGVIINELSVVIGGILGALMGHKLSPKFRQTLPWCSVYVLWEWESVLSA